MALVGSGILAILTDMEPGGDLAFVQWADRDYLCPYCTLPGVLSVRRFFARRAPHKHLVLIEADAFDDVVAGAFSSRDFAPDPAAERIQAKFRNSRRLVLECTASYGYGRGGGLAVIRAKPPADGDRLLGLRLSVAQMLRDIAREPGLLGAHLLEADPGASARQLPGALVSDWPAPSDDWLLVIEGADEPRLATAIGEKLSGPALTLAGFERVDRPGFYRLGMDLHRNEAASARLP